MRKTYSISTHECGGPHPSLMWHIHMNDPVREDTFVGECVPLATVRRLVSERAPRGIRSFILDQLKREGNTAWFN